MAAIKVVVHGALGKMGREVLQGLCRDDDVEPVGAVDKAATGDYLPLPDGSGLIPLSSALNPILLRTSPRVLVDFSQVDAVLPACRIAIGQGVNLVIGTTGLTQRHLQEIEELARGHGVGAVVAPNFALGAVLLMQLARKAAPYFDYAEIIELHHHQKADAPSGTALATARGMAEARGRPFLRPQTQKETLPGTRGGELEGVTIHSVRLEGLLAHQEVIFGGPGQTLSLRHDTVSRECYLPGILLAVKRVAEIKGLVYGLESLLSL